MFGWVRPVGARTKQVVVWSGRRVGRVRLFTAVTLALVSGIGIAVVAQVLLSRVIATNQNQAAPIDITKLALTFVGGVGGAVALVVAYRRQRDLEQNRFVERFGAAAAQLGSVDVAVRIAGVYAMAGVADESVGSNRQQCIDVLCGYLRLPYDTRHGGSGRTKLVTKTKQGESVDLEETTEYRQNDREVRKTIVRVIAEHVRESATHDWCTNTFDFRTAHLEDADFRFARFEGKTHFDATKFFGSTSFERATFTSTASFRAATFSGYADFVGTNFAEGTGFEETSFSDYANFTGAMFYSIVVFEKATFSGIAGFLAATFSGPVEFEATTFSGYANFKKARFLSHARFRRAGFSGQANFAETSYSEFTNFERATFTSIADFRAATFISIANFRAATFSGGASFTEATFSDGASFTKATFSGETGFSRTEFGTREVSFEGPRRWDPPPQFDWEHDMALKPSNVLPATWPPAVV